MNSKIIILSITLLAVIVSTSVGVAYSDITENTQPLEIYVQPTSEDNRLLPAPTPLDLLTDRVTKTESRINAMFQTVTGTMTLGVNETGKLQVQCPKGTEYLSSLKTVLLTPEILPEDNVHIKVRNILDAETIYGNWIEDPIGVYVEVDDHDRKNYFTPITATASIVCLSP